MLERVLFPRELRSCVENLRARSDLNEDAMRLLQKIHYVQVFGLVATAVVVFSAAFFLEEGSSLDFLSEGSGVYVKWFFALSFFVFICWVSLKSHRKDLRRSFLTTTTGEWVYGVSCGTTINQGYKIKYKFNLDGIDFRDENAWVKGMDVSKYKNGDQVLVFYLDNGRCSICSDKKSFLLRCLSSSRCEDLVKILKF